MPGPCCSPALGYKPSRPAILRAQHATLEHEKHPHLTVLNTLPSQVAMILCFKLVAQSYEHHNHGWLLHILLMVYLFVHVCVMYNSVFFVNLFLFKLERPLTKFYPYLLAYGSNYTT